MGGEIAVEASTLYALGYEGELGETLTLTIAPFREDGAGEYTEDAEAGRTLTFTLCGILPAYQEEWEICGDVLFPTALISTTQADVLCAGSAAVSCVLLKTEDGYDCLARELSESGEDAEDLIFNENAYPQLTSTSLEETLRTLRRALLGVSVGILALFVLSYVRSRRETWRTLSLLGADLRQLRRMLRWECLTFWGISAAAGTAAGVLLFRLAVPLFSRIMEKELVYSLSFVHLATGVAVGSLSVWLAYLLPMFFLGQWLETDGKGTGLLHSVRYCAGVSLPRGRLASPPVGSWVRTCAAIRFAGPCSFSWRCWRWESWCRG